MTAAPSYSSNFQSALRPELRHIALGKRPYAEVWEYQKELQQQIIANKLARETDPELTPATHYLLTVEHPPVYTLGKSGKPEHLLLTPAQLNERGAEFYPVERGGDITFHGPGQVVVYPILDLEWYFTDLGRYLRTLEDAVIRTLAEYGIVGGRLPGYTGVWIEPHTPRERKICAMGIKCSRWVTLHGLALNVNTDLDRKSVV